ncbi:hypothetical protein K2X85_15365 [bacterium]|nr:hypothetical protein [bacterium]
MKTRSLNQGWREFCFAVEYALLLPLVKLIRRLPAKQAFLLGSWIAWALYSLLSRDRQWAYKNLQIVFGPTLSRVEQKRIVLASFENIVRTRIECIRWTKEWMFARVCEVGGQQSRQLRAELDRDRRGLIILTVHLGNYELLPAWCHFQGQPSTVMYRPQDNWRVESLLLGSRQEYLPNVVARSAVGLMSLNYLLRDGGNAGLLIDMNTLDDPVFVDFLGFLAASPPGPAALALATDAFVLPMVSVRDPDGTHRVISIHPVIETTRTGNRRRDIELNTARYMHVFEEYILAHPEQYNWPHPRWRLRPGGSFWKLDTPLAEIERERVSTIRSLATTHRVEDRVARAA